MFLEKYSKPLLENIQIVATPYAARSLNSYHQIKKLNGFELVNYELPGRGRRYAASGYKMKEVVEEIVKKINFSEPYVLFGHSMGAYIAYETCAYIERLNLKLPAKIILSGQIPPSSVRAQLYEREMTYNSTLSYLKSMGGTPDEVLQNEELINYYVKILRDDFALLKHYFQEGWSPMIGSDIEVWCGKEDGMIPLSKVQDWKKSTTGQCDIKYFEGGHFFIKQIFDDLHALEGQLHGSCNANANWEERDDA